MHFFKSKACVYINIGLQVCMCVHMYIYVYMQTYKICLQWPSVWDKYGYNTLYVIFNIRKK